MDSHRPRGDGDATTVRRGRGISAAAAVGLTLFAGVFPLIVFPHAVADDTDVLPKVIVTRTVVLVLAAMWIARAVRTGTVAVRRTPLDLPVLALVAAAGVSTVLSVSRPLSLVGGYTRYEGLVTLATYAALFWIGTQFITTPAHARRLLRVMIAGAVVECVVACAQALSASTTLGLNAFGETSTVFGGVPRALGTMANANNLGIWLAMLIPLGLYETISARAWPGRAAASLATALMTTTLVITFGRAAWLGAVCGVALTTVLLLRTTRSHQVAARAAVAMAATAAVVALAGIGAAKLDVPLLGSASQRLASIVDPLGGSGGTRLHLYSDTIGLVAARPLVGYGPDTFGVVYPSHSTGDWTAGVVVDKAHSDLLQVAATEGLVGVGADLWLIVAVARLVIRTRRRPGVAGVAGGLLAYQVGIQLNFAWFPVTAPFWILLIALVALAGVSEERQLRVAARPAVTGALAVAGVAAIVVLAVTQAVEPAIANAHYATALADSTAGRHAAAVREAALAHEGDPAQSEYAALQGDLQADLVGNRPGSGADLHAAQAAYEDALADGDIFSTVALRLTYVDIALGDRNAALSAARAARALDPYGPAVRLVTELEG